jgi:hypothetical protein
MNIFPANFAHFGGADASSAIASLTIENRSKQLTIAAYFNATGNYQAFAKLGGQTTTENFKVPSGMVFWSPGFAIIGNASANGGMELGHGTADFTDNQAGAPTGAVYYTTSAGQYLRLDVATTLRWYPIPILFNGAASDIWPFVRTDSFTNATLYVPGYLVSA